MGQDRWHGLPLHRHQPFFFTVFFLLVMGQEVLLEHQSRLPHIMVMDGNLRVAVPYNKNISFDTSGRGVVKVHGEDLVEIVNRAKEAATAVEYLRARELTTLQERIHVLTDVVQGNSGLGQRVAILEEYSSNNTFSSEALHNLDAKVKTLTSEVSRLSAQLQHIQTLLKTDECISNPCQNGGTCEDGYNSFICRCPHNWEGTLCDSDLNECTNFAGTDLGCQNGATCFNGLGTYECSCAPGFYGVHCTQRSNDCSSASSRDLCGHGMCVNQHGTGRGYTCICDQGWTIDSSSLACTEDVDECTSNHPSCSRSPLVTCINVPGSFYCGGCPQGYTGNGYYCSDIDECQLNNGGCSMNPIVQCLNTQGSRLCGNCPQGYQGDGVTCTFRGVCHINNGGCHSLAHCIENPIIGTNYAQCICPAGYFGSGVGVNGCLQGSALQPSTGGVVIDNSCNSNPCVYGTCHVGPNSYICFCHSGYTGPTCAQHIDPCASKPCKNGGTCVPKQISYNCHCTSEYTGLQCAEQQLNCGGKLLSEEGSLQFPHGGYHQQYPHGVSCAWVITTYSSKVLNLTFLNFHLEKSPECSKDWLQIHDGQSANSQLINRFCGPTLPNNGSIISSQNMLYLWFRSDHTNSSDGFSLKWTSINPECGGELNDITRGTLTSPGFPGKYPKNRDCLWQLSAPYNKRIQLTFFSIMLENHSNCSFDFVEIQEGSGRLVQKFCNTSQPEQLNVNSNVAVIRFHSDGQDSDSGFLLAYSIIPGTPGCGGVLTAPSGTITIANEGRTYKSPGTCEWLIQLPMTERIELTFVNFALPTSRNCEMNYLEIYEGSTKFSQLGARYCGVQTLNPYRSSGNTLLIMFYTVGRFDSPDFHIDYQELCGGVFSEPSGIIKSPLYPEQYPYNKRCIYEIAVSMGKAVILEIQDFQLEGRMHDFLEIRDGHDSNAPLLGKYSGTYIGITPLVSTHNYLWLNFRSDESSSYRGFYANYTTIDINCGGIMKADNGTLQSPSSQNEDGSDYSCRWMIVAPVGKVVQLTWENFHLESNDSCNNSYVEVYDNSSSTGDGGKVGRYCGEIVPPIITSIDTTLTLYFYADLSFSGSFVANYAQLDTSHLCGGKYFTTTGVIRSPQYPNNYPHNKDCTWVIMVPSGQQIMLNVSFFQLEYTHSECRADFLEIRNGGFAMSPLIGIYCGTSIPGRIVSHSNMMYLHFKSDSSFYSKGFEISWDGTSTGCGGTLTSHSGSIISPNFPHAFDRNTECFWRISVSQGSTVRIVFVHLELQSSPKCRFNYIAFYDGVDSLAPQLGKYCSHNRPLKIHSTGNHVYVKFRSDISHNGAGFYLNYNTVCNTEVRGFRGIIESPNFPDKYPAELDCMWVIKVPHGNRVNITFSHFSIYSGRSHRRLVLLNDFVQLNESMNDGLSYTQLTDTLYGTVLPDLIHSSTNQILVVMKSTRHSLGSSGFRLEWILDGCGDVFTRREGEFTSPGYPADYPNNMQCEWTIRLELGNSVQLTVHELLIERTPDCYNDSLTIYGGPDDSSPKLHEPLCQTISAPIITTSSGNSMFIKFVSDFNYAGRGFRATYKTVNSFCGGLFMAPHGKIHSHNYPQNYNPHDDCTWLIKVDVNYVVNFTFTDFDLELSANCTEDYVELYDGDNTNSPILASLCGNNMPNTTSYKSTGNTMTIRMKANGSDSMKGFSANYSIACGARIETDDSGVIDLRDSINVNQNNRNCSWIIMSASPEDRVSLTFTHMDMSSTTNHYSDTCKYSYVEVRDGEDEDAPLLGTFCGSRTPPQITSNGPSLFLRAVSYLSLHYGMFSAFYSVTTAACGGNLTSEHGAFESPNYPNSYSFNTECIWTIATSPGNRVLVNFLTFEMEPSEGCINDYLEVRENNGIGRLIGVYCSDVPSNITAQQRLWIKFRSKGESAASGFKTEYSMLFGNELFSSSGQVASPLYPRPYRQHADYTWRITVSFGKAVAITFNDFFIETFHLECHLFLAIYEGYDETGPKLYKGCGVQLPEPVTSAGNVVFIHFRSTAVIHGSWFLLTWTEVQAISHSLITVPTPSPIPGCGGRISLQPNDQNSSYTEVISPGFPNGYAAGVDCEWIIDTPNTYHMKLIIEIMDIESYSKCYADFVQVFEGEGGNYQWKSVKKLCHQNAIWEEPIYTTNLMKILFHTNHFFNKTGFKAAVLAECGGNIQASNGVIEVNENVNKYNYNGGYYNNKIKICRWNISVRAGRKISVNFQRFTIPANSNNVCLHYYLMVKNGHSAESPLLGDGKYCGHWPSIPETTGNHLFMKYYDDGHGAMTNFKMTFSEVSVACGGQFMLTPDGNASTVITSPNFPNIPHPHTECTWIIMAPGGERIQVDFNDHFDFRHSKNCNDEYVELRDGGTQLSYVIGRYCKKVPDTKMTTGNILHVHYFTDIDDPHTGFKATISIARCGGTIHGLTGRVQSPGYPRAYPSNLECSWRIIGDKDGTISLQFQDIDLPLSQSYCDSSTPHINVSDVFFHFSSTKLLGTYCNMSSGSNILETSSNEALITFKSGSSHLTNFRGFSLNFSKSLKRCGGELTTPSAEISVDSDSYMKCFWKITVPWGRRVTVYALQESPRYFSRSHSNVTFYNGLGTDYVITSLRKGFPIDEYQSTSNKMSVFIDAPNLEHFRFHYNSNLQAACGGYLGTESGIIQVPSQEMSSSSYYCEWNHDGMSSPNQTFVLTIINATLGYPLSNSCAIEGSKMKVVSDGDVVLLADLCRNYTEPYTILSPYSSTSIVVAQSANSGSISVTAQYQTSPCGGLLSGPEETVSSPDPVLHSADVHCAWAVTFQDEQAIKITFTSINLTTPCGQEYVLIHNGPLPSSPLISRLCGSILPETITSQSNQLWIEYHSNSSEQGTGFSLQLSSADGECGGVLHGTGHSIVSPNFPSAYPSNAECEWSIRVDTGYFIMFKFMERFNLEDSANCTNDFVEVYDYVWDEYVSLGKVCGRQTPRQFNSTGSRMKILFRSNANISGDGFKAEWEEKCGGDITNMTSGQLASPGYPSNYGADLYCKYTIRMPGHYITAHFISFSISQESFYCFNDNLTVNSYWNYQWKADTYCGKTAPPDILSKNYLILTFQTNKWDTSSGFLLHFQVSSCGGDITEPGSLVYPRHVDDMDYYNLNCMWVITAPQNQIVKLKFSSLLIQNNKDCFHENSLNIYNGPYANVKNRLAKFCGNLTKFPPTIHSTGNVMTVEYQTFAYKGNFAADIIFTIGEAHGCGGVLNVSQAPQTIRSPDVGSGGSYEPSLDCHWVVLVQKNQVVNLHFTIFDLTPCTNATANSSQYCSCDYLELRDGASQYSELISTYCGNTLPNSIVSSSNQLFIRFVSDGDLNGHGFVAQASSENSVCGLARLRVTNEHKVLTSPNYPSNYPTNLRCRWWLVSEPYKSIDIHIEDLDIRGSGHMCSDAVLQIADVNVRPIVTEGLGENFIFSGQSHRTVQMTSFLPIISAMFCGEGNMMDYFSSGGDVLVKFTSSSTPGKGFKINYSYAGCNRNYTANQGWVKLDSIPESCLITIQAPENNTIAIYFMKLYIPSSSNCDDIGLEFRDGANADSPQLVRACSNFLNPIFSTNSIIRLRMWNTGSYHGNFSFTYTSTDQGPGCGGTMFNYAGVFTSPLYPSNVLSPASCRWDVAVPVGSLIILSFAVLELGMKDTCETDFVELLDTDIQSGVETIRTRYCGGDNPAIFISTSNRMVVRYVTSARNMGNGWVAHFLATTPGTRFYDRTVN